MSIFMSIFINVYFMSLFINVYFLQDVETLHYVLFDNMNKSYWVHNLHFLSTLVAIQM